MPANGVFAFTEVSRLAGGTTASGNAAKHPLRAAAPLARRTPIQSTTQERGGAQAPAGTSPVGVEAHRSLTVHFSSRSDEWPTPQGLFDALDAEFGFTLDPCSTHANANWEEDGLAQDWKGAVVFMNPPYGREIGRWMRKAFESAQAGATVVCLVPARTDTSWWHNCAIHGEVRFLRGRLKFGGARHCAPFPSAIVIFRGHLTRSNTRAAAD